MKTRRSLGAIAVALALVGGHWHSTGQVIIAEHFGANNPTNESFSLILGTVGEVGPVIGDLGLDSWSISGGTAFYRRFLTAQELGLAATGDWTISLTLRMVASAGPLGGTFATFATGTQEFWMGFGLESNGDPFVSAEGSGARYVLEGGGLGYHNYQLRFDSLTGTADVWVDGVERFSNVAPLRPNQQAVFTWGAAQSPDLVTANWNLVSLSIVPEPSSLALWLCGGLLVAAQFRRRNLQNATASVKSVR